MTLTLNITDDLKPDELQDLVEIAREEGSPIGVVILEAARERARARRALRERAALEAGAAIPQAA